VDSVGSGTPAVRDRRGASGSIVLVALLAVAIAAALVRIPLGSGQGLRAEYVAAPAAGGAAHIAIASEISTRELTRAWSGSPPPQFRARWTGYIVVGRSGSYTFATTSDDGSTVTIDGQRVVDNSGDHSAQTRSGRIDLQTGAHGVSIDYSQAAGEYELTWLWAREGGALTPVPSWALWTRRTSYVRAVALRGVEILLVLSLAGFVIAAAVTLWNEKGRALTTSAWQTWQSRPRRQAVDRRVQPRAVVKILLPVVSVAVAILAAEFVARIVFRSVRSSGDARNFFAARSEPDRVNSLGYRGPEVPPKGDRYRIAVVGDSITWGIGLDEDQRFSNVLQRSLGTAYEVLNLGIPGHNMPEHLQTLGYALSLSPDFVLLQLYTNDFETPTMERPRAKPLLPWRSVDLWLRRSSVLYTMASAQWPRVQEKIGVTESYVQYMKRHLGDSQSPDSRESFGMLHEFIHRARAAGVPVGTVMFPNPEIMQANYPYGYLHDRVASVCGEERIHCVDLRAAFRSNFSDVKDIVVSPFDGHPSAKASVVAANAILEVFKTLWQPCVARPYPCGETNDRSHAR
jgi:lysophospholipase L1-like esterase